MEIITESLVLRTVAHDDVAEVARTWNFEKGEISHQDAAEAIDWMLENHKQNRLHKIVHACFAVFENNADRIIGWCGLDGTKDNIVHIFYMIDKEHRRRGYATECAEKLLEFGFTAMELERIDGGCAVDNIASRKILEKIGMKRIEDDEHGIRFFITNKDYAVKAASS